jgi:hypothetical protein
MPALDWGAFGELPVRTILCTLSLLVLVPAPAFADEVYLKGGAVFSGRIVEQTKTTVSVDIGEGVVGVPMSRVERIVKGRSPLDEYDERARGLAPKDVDGWRSLGHWASQQGLAKQSRQAYETVLATAPDDTESRLALGFVRLDGRWLTEEEGYRAQGYVLYDGEWMTPTEAQLSQAAAAAEQSRQEAERRATEAEIAAQDAEARAQDAEQRAREAQQTSGQNDPVYWGEWGYGVTYWPTTTAVARWPANRPAQLPPRRHR